MKEEWRDIPGYEGYYQVSDQGRVKSTARTITRTKGVYRIAERILKQTTYDKWGHLQVGLYRDGLDIKAKVHQLVLLAFVGSRPEGMMSCHNDGNASNNCLTNLRWDTSSNNSKDRAKHGTHQNALKTNCPRDHEYTKENTRLQIKPNGVISRSCIICMNLVNDKNKALRAENRMKNARS